MYKVTNVTSYLHRINFSTNPTIGNSEIELWGDVFCIYWLSKWLNIQVCVWSLTRGKKYLHFNRTSHVESYSLLFHDNNPLCGHFEPLVCSKFNFTSNQLQQQFNNASTHKQHKKLCQLQLPLIEKKNTNQRISLPTIKNLIRDSNQTDINKLFTPFQNPTKTAKKCRKRKNSPQRRKKTLSPI